MASAEIRGIIVPVITPLDDEENVDEKAFRELLRRLVAAGVHGVFVGGTAGEGPLLAAGEWRRMVEIAFDEAGGKILLLAGVMEMSTRRVREKVRILEAIGCTHFVLTPTFYVITRSATEHLRLFAAAREAGAGMEMVAYNLPVSTGASIAVETVLEMVRRGWIRCCKESSGDLAFFRELIERGRDLGLSVLIGDEPVMIDGLKAGAKGLVPGCANVFPGIYLRLYEQACGGDWDAAVETHRLALRVRGPLVVDGTCWLAGIKYAAALTGIGTGRLVSPLEPCGARQREAIERLVRERPS
jgi:4-hydroxy-tetrahydrodipicolinate synthase